MHEVSEVREGNGPVREGHVVGADMRTYVCRPCKEYVDVDNGIALWQVLHDANEKAREKK
jgi:hypothetical protein